MDRWVDDGIDRWTDEGWMDGWMKEGEHVVACDYNLLSFRIFSEKQLTFILIITLI